MRRGLHAFVVLTLVVVLALAACGPGGGGTQQPAEPIKIGVVDVYSEGPAIFGQDALNGFKLAVDEINAAGGVLGHKLEYTTRDSKFKVDVGLSMAKELVLNEDVDLLVGTTNSSVALAVSEYAKEQQIPFIVWMAKSENITGAKGHRYVFSTTENTAMAGKAGAIALAALPYTRYWIAGDDYEYGHAIADGAWRNLEVLKPGVEKVGESWWKVGEPDLIPYFTAILAAQPEVVIFATGGNSMANTMKAIKSTGMMDQVQAVWIHTATDHAVLKPLGLDAPAGVLGTMDYHFYYPETPANQAFVDAFTKAYDYPPGSPAYHAYLTAHLIAKAYEKAGTTDTEKFIDALEGLTIDGPGGPVTMRACDHQLVLPIFTGKTGMVPEYYFMVSTDIKTLAGDQLMPSCEEIQAARGNQ